MFDCLIIVICITSFILCTRSIITGIRLQCVSEPILGIDPPYVLLTPSWCCKQEYTQYCRSSSGKDPPWSDKLEFVSGWYILIIVSDTLSIVGSILKIEIQNKVVAVRANPGELQHLPFYRRLLALLGRHKLRHLQHLPRNGNHASVDRSHPLHGLLQEV